MTAGDAQKSAHGGWAAIVWIIGSILLLLFDSDSPSLFSWMGLTFLVIGMFAASIIAGGISYLIQRAVGDRLARNAARQNLEVSPENATNFRTIGWLLFALDTLIAIGFLYLVYGAIFRSLFQQ